MAKYEQSRIMFDSCNAGMSIKEHEQKRRTSRTFSANIQLEDGLQVSIHQELLLSNENNKDQFVNMLCRYLEADGHRVVQLERNTHGHCFGNAQTNC